MYSSLKRLLKRWGLYRAVVVILLVCVIPLVVVYRSPTDTTLYGGKVHSPLFGTEQMKRLPQCIIIGAKKAGTRALLTFLNLHPDIAAASNEVHFFDVEENYRLGQEWYRLQMPLSTANQITIEKSPAYFNEEIVPERVRHMNQSIKLLLIVSDPIRRAVSDYYQVYLNNVDKGGELKSFKEKVLHPNGSINMDSTVLQKSLYVNHMKRWLRYFKREQFHLVHGEAFIRNPTKELAKVENFLGLQHFLDEKQFYFNQTKGFHCFYRNKQSTCLGERKGRTLPNIDPKTFTALGKLFSPYNKRFYELIGEDFGWDYLM